MDVIFFMGIPYALFVATTIFLSIRIVTKSILKKNQVYSKFRLLFSEIMYTTVGPILGFMRYDEYGPDIPFCKAHDTSLILLVFISSLAFWISKFAGSSCNKFLKTVLSVAIFQGIIVCLITSIHLIPRLSDGLIFPIFGFEMLAPIVCFFLLSKELYFLNSKQKKEASFQPELKEENKVQEILIYPLVLIGLLFLEIGVATVMGQDADSLIKVYTLSKGFIFSN